MKNLGVIIEHKPKDYFAGKLPYEVLNPTGDWTLYEPSPENQFSNYADSMACVTFSALNCIETQYKFLTGEDINFSDRFIAKMSGTTHQGNSMQRVLDTIKQVGLVLEKDYPTPNSFSWDEYYAPIPQEVFAKAQKTDISYEFGSTDYEKDLKQAPLQMIIEKDNPYHAVEMVSINKMFDSYPPYDKPQKSIHTVCKIILKGVKMLIPKRVVKADGITFGVVIDGPNGAQIIYATDEEQWRSWNKPDSYQLPTVNADDSTNWSYDYQLPF